MKELRAKLNALKELRAALHEKWDTLTTKQVGEETLKIKEAGAALQTILTEGAKDCEGGHRPLGLFHEGTANPFEIGDPVTPNRRARGAFLEDAVEKWNDDEWLPPREPETVVATHKDAGGNIISQTEAKLQRK
jgi:hypothetical protein